MSRFPAALLALALGVLPAPLLHALDEVSAGFHVAVVEGEAVVRLAGDEEWVAFEADIPLDPGDRVRVADGGRVALVNGAGDTVEVQEGSELEVTAAAPEESFFRLFLGGLLAKVSPDAGKKFRVATPLAAVAVRGTEFGVDVEEDGASELGVTEGEVEFQEVDEAGNFRGEPLRVASNAGATLRRGERPRPSAQLPPRARRRLVRMAVLRENAPRWRGRWKAVPAEERRAVRRRLAERWRQMPAERRDRIREKIQRRWKDGPRGPRQGLHRDPRPRPARRARPGR